MSGPCPVVPAGPFCTTAAAGAYDTTHDLVRSRYAGNAQFDQAWVDAPSPITVDDVRFSSDNVPGDWATMDAFLGNFGPPTPEEAFLHAYYYAFTAYGDVCVAPAPDFKVAVDLKQEFEVCGLHLEQVLESFANSGGDTRSCSGRVFVCCEMECTSRTLLHMERRRLVPALVVRRRPPLLAVARAATRQPRDWPILPGGF